MIKIGALLSIYAVAASVKVEIQYILKKNAKLNC